MPFLFLKKLSLLLHLFTTCFFQGPPSSISVNRRRRSRSIRPSLSGTTAALTPRKSPPNSARGPARIAARSHTRRRTVLVGYQFFVNLSFRDLRFMISYLGVIHVGSRRMCLNPGVVPPWLVPVSMPT
jgi:hypothetical protein